MVKLAPPSVKNFTGFTLSYPSLKPLCYNSYMPLPPAPTTASTSPQDRISNLQLQVALRSPLDLAEMLFPETKRWPQTVLLNSHLVALARYRLTASGPIPDGDRTKWYFLPVGSDVEVEVSSPQDLPDHSDGIRGVHTATGEEIVFSLNVSMMPRSGKSRLVNEVFPIWCWLLDPRANIGLATYSDDFAGDWGYDMRQLLDEVQDKFPWLPKTARGLRGPRDVIQNAAGKGWLYFVGTAGKINGKSLQVQVADDLIKNETDALSSKTRNHVNRYLKSTWFTRKTADRRPGAAFPIPIEVQMGTRWHEDDPTGNRCYDPDTKEALPEWCILNIPALCTSEDDPLHRQIGEAHPNAGNHTRKSLLKLQLADKRTFSAQYQGSPTPEGGGLLNTDYKTFVETGPDLVYTVHEADRSMQHSVPRADCIIFGSTDMAATKTSTADWTVQGIFAYHRETEMLFLLSMFRGKITTDEYRETLFPLLDVEGVRKVCVENVTYGQKYGQDLKRAKYVPEFMPKSGDKVARAESSDISFFAKQGLLRLPRGFAERQTLVDEVSIFPYGKNDDIVDMLAFAGLFVQSLPVFRKKREPEKVLSIAERDFLRSERDHERRRRGKSSSRRRDRWSIM